MQWISDVLTGGNFVATRLLMCT